jgi:hypothetical protein
VLDSPNPHYDEKVDVYSFGIVMWEIASSMREMPFQEFAKKNIREHVVIDLIITKGLRPTIPSECPKEYAALMQSVRSIM